MYIHMYAYILWLRVMIPCLHYIMIPLWLALAAASVRQICFGRWFFACLQDIYMCIYIYIYTHTYIHTHTCIHTHTNNNNMSILLYNITLYTHKLSLRLSVWHSCWLLCLRFLNDSFAYGLADMWCVCVCVCAWVRARLHWPLGMCECACLPTCLHAPFAGSLAPWLPGSLRPSCSPWTQLLPLTRWSVRTSSWLELFQARITWCRVTSQKRTRFALHCLGLRCATVHCFASLHLPRLSGTKMLERS